jgi:hypothetical protein
MQKLLASAGLTTRALSHPAAEIANSAAPLAGLLGQVKPFEQAAVPALNRAASVSPQLTGLGRQATPVIQRGVPTLAALENIARIARPLTYWLGANIGTGPGIDGVLGVVQGWAQAIQYRDGLGHIFHGAVQLDPSLVVKLANSGVTSAAAKRENKRAAEKVLSGAAASSAAPTAAPARGPTSAAPGQAGISTLLQALTGAAQGLAGPLRGITGSGGSPGSANPLSSLLRYLLGK